MNTDPSHSRLRQSGVHSLCSGPICSQMGGMLGLFGLADRSVVHSRCLRALILIHSNLLPGFSRMHERLLLGILSLRLTLALYAMLFDGFRGRNNGGGGAQRSLQIFPVR